MKYEIKYTETLYGKLIVEADTPEQAVDKIHEMYNKGIVLTDDATHSTIAEDLNLIGQPRKVD